MLERLARHSYFFYLDGYSRYFQIPIHPYDQEKTNFTCPYGTLSYRRMSFGLCNTPATFQRCMMEIFTDFLDDIIEVFMDDFSVYGSTFKGCLTNLEKVLDMCVKVNLVPLKIVGKPSPCWPEAYLEPQIQQSWIMPL